MRVTIPENVKHQMQEDIKRDVAPPKQKNWAAVDGACRLNGFTKSGLAMYFRFRSDFFPEGNDNTGVSPTSTPSTLDRSLTLAARCFPPQQMLIQIAVAFQVHYVWH